MSISDDELRAQLERRRNSVPLDQVQRAEIVEAIHEKTTSSGRTVAGWSSWRWLTAAVALTVVALVVVLAYPRASTLGPPSQSSSGLVLTAQQLADRVTARNSIGQLVLARAKVQSDLNFANCQGRNPCYPRVLAGTNPPVEVNLGTYPDPIGADVLAFRIQDGHVTYIGPSSVADGDKSWTVATVDLSTDVLQPVNAWLIGGQPVECPVPAAGTPACLSNDWLAPTPDQNDPPRDALSVQEGAYDAFAVNPTRDRGIGAPRSGVYLVAPTTCRPLRLSACSAQAAAQLIGRLDPPMSSSPSPSTSASLEPTPTPEIKHWSVAELLAAAPSTASDETYAVDGWLSQGLPAACPAPPDFSASQDYWCGGSWITDAAPTTSGGQSIQLVIPGAIHVQWSAYQDFAPNPQVGANGGEPRQGIYLVKPAGCPANVMGDCPVFEMVGRSDLPMSAATETTTPPPSAPVVSPTAPATPWWILFNGPTSCGFPGEYRIVGNPPRALGNCTGLLLEPPDVIDLNAGDELDVHLDHGIPVSPDDSVLRITATEDDGNTARYLATGDGEVVLSTNGLCLDNTSNAETNGPCPVLDVRVGFGAPTEIDGQAVYEGADIPPALAAAVGDDPLLILGKLTFSNVVVDCMPNPSLAALPLLYSCDSPARYVFYSFKDSYYQVAPLIEPGIDVPVDQYVVLRVHVHDPRAADCPPDYRAQCEAAVVVEGIAWPASSPSP